MGNGCNRWHYREDRESVGFVGGVGRWGDGGRWGPTPFPSQEGNGEMGRIFDE
ncbi:MAG: hypothetical protein F6K50_37425 [Moorea sp. SIO3I7]|uniref:hypothetical protein n=1 Tax=Moorena sp. SIO3I8 TaxID=2607833 RepID=UPI0013C1641C|nr:hypothetical protein [Moorena sp. SIO3I8]NEO00903.1 hypothetical protein [Moorena sp. SIO3I7]NEO06623.1 hypothetical protein [Moorena sp. SIO3I8]